MDKVTVTVCIDRWKDGPDDFADFIWSVIRDTVHPTIASRIDVKVAQNG